MADFQIGLFISQIFAGKTDGEGSPFDSVVSDTPTKTPQTRETPGLACFAEDTVILTNRGEVPITELCVGERLPTYDLGTQTLLGIRSQQFSVADLLGAPELRPLCVSGSLFPAQDEIRLSPEHCIHYKSAIAQYYFGTAEVLLRAKHLEPAGYAQSQIPRAGIRYFQLLMEHHSLVMANGFWAESFCKYPDVEDSVNPRDTWSLHDGVELANIRHRKTVRPVLQSFETELLLSSAQPIRKPKTAPNAPVGSRLNLG